MKYRLKDAVVLVRPTATWIGSGKSFAIRRERAEQSFRLIESAGFEHSYKWDKITKENTNTKKDIVIESFIRPITPASRLVMLDDVVMEITKNLPSPLKEMADADLVEVIVDPDRLWFERV